MKSLSTFGAALAILLLVSSPSVTATAQVIAGAAIAADGDLLVVAGQKVRLFGIDAPEYNQTCQRGSETWECGKTAKEQLAALVQGARVECRRVSTDEYGRAVSTCFAGSDELNRTMVEQGWAVAYREYSSAYEMEELQARRNGLGIWSGEFQRPSDYRHAQEPKPRSAAPRVERPRAASQPRFSGCVIKGNRNRHGEWIYHLPGMPYYEATRPEEIFCSEAEAQAAGYRRAIVRP